jgi:hypothetical protein
MSKEAIRKFDLQFFGEGAGGAPEGEPAPKPDGDPTPKDKTFTQTDVDKIVEKRLASERKKYEGFDEIKTKAQKLDELENKKLEESGKFEELLAQKEAAHKAELAKLQEQLSAIDAEKKTREIYKLKKEALAKAMKTTEDKISDDMIGFIGGDEEEKIKTNVALFAKLLPAVKTTDGGGNPPNDKSKDSEAYQAVVEQVVKDAAYEKKMREAQEAYFGK